MKIFIFLILLISSLFFTSCALEGDLSPRPVVGQECTLEGGVIGVIQAHEGSFRCIAEDLQ